MLQDSCCAARLNDRTKDSADAGTTTKTANTSLFWCANHLQSRLRPQFSTPRNLYKSTTHLVVYKDVAEIDSTGAAMLKEDLSQVEITGLPSLNEAVLDLRRTFDDGIPVWRGHANIDWLLQPEVFRTRADGRRYSEVSLIRSFMAMAESRGAKCPPSNDFASWLILARHYGLPTRLLDWSANPFVALYFAAQNDTHDGCLWAIYPFYMNLQMLRGEGRLLAFDDPKSIAIASIAFEVDQVTACRYSVPGVGVGVPPSTHAGAAARWRRGGGIDVCATPHPPAARGKVCDLAVGG
jgi:hypothetical protein